jgi:hypothetical protein
MKLYTELEIRNFFTEKYNDELSIDELIEILTPIELPTDEEIKTESKFKSNYSNPQAVQFNPALNIVWIEGAKWMRNKIQGGDK